jgi:CRP-like cAMP-binding protein
MNVFDRINDSIRNTEASLVNLLSAIAPWGAPLAPAYMAFHGMVDRLGFSLPVALVLAGVIEILGLATVSTAIQFWQHNRRQSAEYRRMPVIVPAGMFAFYLAVVVTVNVLLELPIPDQYHIPVIARALLTFLSIPAAVTLAIRTQYAELQREIKAVEDARKLEKEQRKIEERERKERERRAQQAERMAQEERNRQEREWQALSSREKMLSFFTQYPDATLEDAGKAVGVSRQRAGQILGELESEGLVHRNGKVKVNEHADRGAQS